MVHESIDEYSSLLWESNIILSLRFGMYVITKHKPADFGSSLLVLPASQSEGSMPVLSARGLTGNLVFPQSVAHIASLVLGCSCAGLKQ